MEPEENFEEEIEIHNKVCLKSPLRKEEWLGCPYPLNEHKNYNPELFRCNLCGIEILRDAVWENKKLKFINRHWRKWLLESVKK